MGLSAHTARDQGWCKAPQGTGLSRCTNAATYLHLDARPQPSTESAACLTLSLVGTRQFFQAAVRLRAILPPCPLPFCASAPPVT